jgi:hypothetical protein
MLKKPKPGGGDAGLHENVGNLERRVLSQTDHAHQVRAELHGTDSATALGITVHANAPVLELSRRLIAAGHDPATGLEAYRGEMLCLRVRAIGEAAALEVNAKGTGFISRRAVRTAPPIEKSHRAYVGHRPGSGAAR